MAISNSVWASTSTDIERIIVGESMISIWLLVI